MCMQSSRQSCCKKFDGRLINTELEKVENYVLQCFKLDTRLLEVFNGQFRKNIQERTTCLWRRIRAAMVLNTKKEEKL